MYDVVFTRKAAKSVGELPKAQRENLRTVIADMKSNPFSHPYRKIRGEANLYRIRLGAYRMLYEVNESLKRVIILKLDRRSKVYDR